jgi:hypothetical protein
VLTGCGGDDVHVDRYAVGSADRTSCSELLDAAPRELADESSRKVTGSEYAVAWGDPAIVLLCGVARAKSAQGDPCFSRDGIGWTIPAEQADDLDADLVMTLAFRTPVLQVRVPAHYRPNAPGDVMADLDAVVRAHTTAHGECS